MRSFLNFLQLLPCVKPPAIINSLHTQILMQLLSCLYLVFLEQNKEQTANQSVELPSLLHRGTKVFLCDVTGNSFEAVDICTSQNFEFPFQKRPHENTESKHSGFADL